MHTPSVRRRLGLIGHFRAASAAALIALTPAPMPAEVSPALQPLDTLTPTLTALYTHLHQNPEISLFEGKTAAEMARRLRDLGYEVTEKIGGHGSAPHLVINPIVIASRSFVRIVGLLPTP